MIQRDPHDEHGNRPPTTPKHPLVAVPLPRLVPEIGEDRGVSYDYRRRSQGLPENHQHQEEEKDLCYVVFLEYLRGK